MNNLKKAILERMINCGKKNKRLQAPVMILITLFLILFHGIRNFFMQFKLHPFRRRVLASVFCICLVVSSMPAVDGAFPVLAAEDSEELQENEQEEIQENTYDGVYEIVLFTELSDEIKEQTVAVGTPLENLALPDTLTVVCRMANEKDPEDNAGSDKGQDSEEKDKQPNEGGEENPEEDSDEGAGDVPGDFGNEGEGTEDESGDADNGGEVTGDESIDSDNEDEYIDSSSEDKENEKIVETQETFIVTLPEYYAMPDEQPEIKELFHEETVTLGGITWESVPEYNGEMEGVYLFTPVISDGAYTLTEDVKLPEISVTVAEPEIMPAEEELPDVSGSTTPVCGVISSDTTWGEGELSGGILTVEEGVTLTITGVMTVSDNVTINGGGTIKRGDADACFNMSSGSNVIMSRIVIDGDSLEATENSMIDVDRDSTLTLDDGCVIEKCASAGVEGSAIYNSGTVIMNSSTIKNCYTNTGGGAIHNSGTVVMNGCTIRNCHAGQGGAIYTIAGSINIKYATIEKCYTSSYGGAIALVTPKANVIIDDGMFINNRALGSGLLSGWGGGCICVAQGKLYIYGGNFIGNKSGFAGSCVSHSAFEGTVTEITGGYFEGNGKNAIFVEAAVSGIGNEFILSGDIHFGNGGSDDADIDGVEVKFGEYGIGANGNPIQGKIWISGTIISTVPVYLLEYLSDDIPTFEGLVIAEGKDDYKLSTNDAKKISVTNTSAPEEIWYAVLDEARNVIYLSQDEPTYTYRVNYHSNGAEGTVTDNKEYTDTDNTVMVKDAEALNYDGYVFDRWNTQADGTGTSYKPGDTFIITTDTDLYAQWMLKDAEYTEEDYPQSGSGDGYSKAEADTETSIGTVVGEVVNTVPVTYSGSTEKTANPVRETEPRTGDISHLEVYATIAMVSGLLYVLLYFTTDRNGMTQEEKEQFLSCLISWAKRGGKLRRLLATAVIFLFLVYYHSIGKCVVYDEKEIRV